MREDDDCDWQSAQHADELNRQQMAVEALLEAQRHGTPREAVLLLADEAGIGHFYRKHYTN